MLCKFFIYYWCGVVFNKYKHYKIALVASSKDSTEGSSYKDIARPVLKLQPSRRQKSNVKDIFRVELQIELRGQ